MVFFLFFISLCISCSYSTSTASKFNTETDIIRESKFLSLYPHFNILDLSTALDEKIKNDTLLAPFYLATNNNLIWLKDTLNTSKLGELVSILSDVDKHGLPKQIFPTEKIVAITQAIDSGLYANSMDTLYQELIALEQLASASSLRYALGMRYGFLDPKDLYGREYNLTIDKPTKDDLQQLYSQLNEEAIATLLASPPNDSNYIVLQREYQKLDSLKNISIPKIPVKAKAKYKLQDKGDYVDAIAKRLAVTGEYVYPDSISLDSLGYAAVDEALLNAINEFRRKNSYHESEEIDAFTIEALNRPLVDYQNKIKANLERHRWRRTKEIHPKHIEVNVAAQRLIATDNEEPILDMRVAVGRLANKTPLIQSDLSYINLNPIWNVPTSITRNELVVKQKANQEYLQRQNMKLYKSGEEVAIESIDWDNVDAQSFGYSIKQAAGSANALGKMKFMFNNNFSVYLHDTPSKSAFNRNNRAVSHGCVRLQQPIDLVLFCTAPNEPLFVDRLYNTIGMKAPSLEGQQLQVENKLTKMNDIIRRDEGISILIDYYTAYLKPKDSTVYYANDVYSYDEPILNSLANLAD